MGKKCNKYCGKTVKCEWKNDVIFKWKEGLFSDILLCTNICTIKNNINIQQVYLYSDDAIRFECRCTEWFADIVIIHNYDICINKNMRYEIGFLKNTHISLGISTITTDQG